MRVLYCEHQRSWSGQTGRVLDDARELAREGVAVRLVCSPGSALEARARAALIECVPIPLRYRPRPLRELRRAIRAFRPDVVHAHGARDHMCALVAGSLTGRALVRTKHNMNPLKSGAFSRLMYGRLTDRLIAISQAVKDALVADGILPEHIAIVRGGIDLDRYAARPTAPGDRARLGLAEDGVLVAMVGRLAISKGSELLFSAIPEVIARRPDVRFVIVGRGEFWPGYLAAPEQDAIRGHVTLTGQVDDVRPYIAAADAVVVPSLKEGLGSAILEAMAAGRPALGSRTGGIPELIVPGETGELFEPGDRAALVAAILDFADHPERWPGYRERALRRAALFDVRRLGRALIEVYEEALRVKRRRG